MKKTRKIGQVPPGRIPVLDRAGNVRGNVGPCVNSSATAARFTGQHGAKLMKVKGRDSWAFPK